MSNRKNIEELAAEINTIPDNIKSEIIVAGILEAGVSPKSLQIENVGNFTRPYSKDLLETAVVEFLRNKPFLRLKLSRNGIYDLLPEGITHSQQVNDGGAEEISTLTQGYKLRKSEEAAARKFFKPFEQEFFLQRVKLEQEEQELLLNSSSIFHDFLAEFWNISGELDLKYETILLRMMPFIHEIAGDFVKIKICLEKILNVNISYSVEHRTQQFKSDYNKLGKCLLGRNFTVGSCLYAIPYTIFNIGPVPKDQLEEFLPGGKIDKFIQIFFRYTIPFETEIISNILIGKEEKKEKDTDFGVLGYSTTI